MTVDGKATEYAYNDSPIFVKIPGGSQYTLQFGTLKNYAAPVDTNTYTAMAGFSNTLTYQYTAHLLTFRFTPTNATGALSYPDESESGTITVKVSNGDSVLIPMKIVEGATRYLNFTPDELDGYASPKTNSIALTPPSQTINLVWEEKPKQVFIMDATGNLVDVNSWAGGSNATGVALINDHVSIVIAPDEWYSSFNSNPWNTQRESSWSYKWGKVSDIYETDDMSEACTNFDGEYYTDALMTNLVGGYQCDFVGVTDYNASGVNWYSGAPAAEYCRAYSNGCKEQGCWYLPSIGELNQMYVNRNEIQAALDKISGTRIGSSSSNWILSSIQREDDSRYCWFYYWHDSNGTATFTDKQSGNVVRPICKINGTRSDWRWFKLDLYDRIIWFKEGDTWADFNNSKYVTNNFILDSYCTTSPTSYKYIYSSYGSIYSYYVNKIDIRDVDGSASDLAGSSSISWAYGRSANIYKDNSSGVILSTDQIIPGHTYRVGVFEK